MTAKPLVGAFVYHLYLFNERMSITLAWFACAVFLTRLCALEEHLWKYCTLETATETHYGCSVVTVFYTSKMTEKSEYYKEAKKLSGILHQIYTMWQYGSRPSDRGWKKRHREEKQL